MGVELFTVLSSLIIIQVLLVLTIILWTQNDALSPLHKQPDTDDPEDQLSVGEMKVDNSNVTVIFLTQNDFLMQVQTRFKSSSINYIIVITNSQTEKPNSALKGLKYIESALIKARHQNPSKHLVIISDAYDVVLSAWREEEVWDTYSKFDSNIVLSVEPTCWPIEYCEKEAIKQYENVVGSDLYVNSGLLGGDLKSLIYLFTWSTVNVPNMDDQERLHRFYLNHRGKTALPVGNWTPTNLVRLDMKYSLFWTSMSDVIYQLQPGEDTTGETERIFERNGCDSHGKPLLTYKDNNSAIIRCSLESKCVFSATDCAKSWIPVKRHNDTCLFRRDVPNKSQPFALHFNGVSKNALQTFMNMYQNECLLYDAQNLLNILA